MNTKCNTDQLAFQCLGRREVVGRFNGGEISSDGGGLLLREVEQRTHILRRLSACFTDHRDPTRIEHGLETLVKQRVFGIALGYEASGAAARLFKECRYQTLTSWSCARRVVGKAEHLSKGANPRFIVSSLPSGEYDARALYEDLYCARGDMENRIKEQRQSVASVLFFVCLRAIGLVCRPHVDP